MLIQQPMLWFCFEELPSYWVNVNGIAEKLCFQFRSTIISEMLVFSMTCTHRRVMADLRNKISGVNNLGEVT